MARDGYGQYARNTAGHRVRCGRSWSRHRGRLGEAQKSSMFGARGRPAWPCLLRPLPMRAAASNVPRRYAGEEPRVPRYRQARAPIIRDLLQPALHESASAGWAFYTATTLGGRIHFPCSLHPAPLLRAPYPGYLHPCRVTRARLVSSVCPARCPCACYVQCRVIICTCRLLPLHLHPLGASFPLLVSLFAQPCPALRCLVLPGCLPTDKQPPT